MLKQILDIFVEPDRVVVQHTNHLRVLVDGHHSLCLVLYGVGILKIKPHLLYHILDSIDEFGVAPNCFCAERNHQAPKSFAMSCQLKGARYELNILRRSVLHTMKAFKNSKFVGTYLVDGRPAPWLQESLLNIDPNFGTDIEVSESMKTERGLFSKGDLVLVVGGGHASIGAAMFFICGQTLRSTLHYFVTFMLYVKVGGDSWASTGSMLTCPSTCLVASLPYLENPGTNVVQPLLPCIPGLSL